MPRTRYTREILEDAVRGRRSVSDVLRKLGLRLTGGGHAHLRRRLVFFQIDVSHFLGPRWNSKPLVLQVDHINGLHHDYRPENLRFLCPNCHSQTLNFSSRNTAYAEVAKR